MFLLGLRVISILLALLILSEQMTSRITMSFPEPALLIPLLALILILIVPRLIISALVWAKCLFSAQLKSQWAKYEIPINEQSDQKSEYFTKYLKRGIYSIFVYPIHPNQYFYIFYVNLEIVILIIWYVYLYGDPKELTGNQYNFLLILFTYYGCVLIRILYEKLILSQPKSRFLLAQQIVQKCKRIIQELESEKPPTFVTMKKDILEFTDFYLKRVIGKKFVTNRGIQKYLDYNEEILEMFTLPCNFKTKNALITKDPAKISEDGKHVVLKQLPIWSFVNYFCCQVLVYYSEKHRSIFEKFELFQNLKRLHKFKTVNFNMTDEERDVLLSFVEILQPLSFICIINFHTSPTFNYTAIQNFTHFEFPLGSTAVRDVDIEKLAYVLESVVAAKKFDWNLADLNNLCLDIFPQKEEIEFEPILVEYDDIPFVDAQF